MKKGARSTPRPQRRSRVETTGERIKAADFKARCLKLMDRVRERRATYVVTKHGKPVAQLVPYTEAKPTRFFGFMKGTLLRYERPYDRIDGEYDIDVPAGLKNRPKKTD